MDGEISTLLNNNLALLQEIKQMLEGGQSAPEQNNILENQNMTKAENEGSPEDEKEDAAELAQKALVQSETDSADANDSPEDRIDEQKPEATEENAKEVAKQLMRLLGGKAPVKKSLVNPSDKIQQETLKVLKAMAVKQQETEQAIVNILKGMGIADEVKKSVDYQAQQTVRKTQNNDVKELAQVFKDFLSVSQGKESENLSKDQKVRKTLSNPSILAGLVRK